jgi:DNA-binding NarL/FixJ family response regulator
MRPKYESAGLATRAQALVALGRKKDAIADSTAAVDSARRTGDPALFLRAVAAALRIEPESGIAAEAYESIVGIRGALSDPHLRRSFDESETVQFVLGTQRRAPRPRFPDGLSEREVEVLRLVAAGNSNSQIAAELIISVNTVQHHVASILTKTGLTNRTQAASYAHRAGILEAVE